MGEAGELCNSTVAVNMAVGGITSAVDEGMITGMLVGGSVEVDSTTAVGVVVEQEVRRKIATMKIFFMNVSLRRIGVSAL